jgi:3-oxoacyl-[acyl-carrier-protein] synthase-1
LIYWIIASGVPMQALAITHLSSVNALGPGCAATETALRQRRPGLAPNDFTADPLPTWIGRVAGLEQAPVGAALSDFDCRNNRLALMALESDGFRDAVAAAAARLGRSRIGVFVGTSTSGILETELAYRAGGGSAPADPRRAACQQNIFSVARFTQAVLGLEGPALAVSTACSSSAKAFAHAARYLQAGVCDAAVVGGVDSLCYTTLYGFHALQLLSPAPCRPCDAQRGGISIGEAGSFALLEPRPEGAPFMLLGYGESSDAHHMSSPDPGGAGALAVMRGALGRAGCAPGQVDAVVMHGTATLLNDAVEDAAIHALLGPDVPVSSVKGWTGHTLGAAGMVNVLAARCALDGQFLPGTLNTERVDPGFRSNVRLAAEPARLARVMVNAFGFGGSNCALVLGRPA